jgi:hypothetical protein
MTKKLAIRRRMARNLKRMLRELATQDVILTAICKDCGR